MDWCWYLAVKILGMSEEEFYKTTPKKLFKLAEIHQQINNSSSSSASAPAKKVEEKYIDQIFL